MSNPPEILAAGAINGETELSRRQIPVESFGTRLAFRLHGFRIGLELTLCVMFYTVLKNFLPFPLPGVALEGQQLFAWFASCVAVALLDQLVFMRPFRLYRIACALELQERYDDALTLLEVVAPKGKALIPLPHSLYHLRRAMIFVHAEKFANAAHELSEAFSTGLNAMDYYVARSELFRYRKEYESARGELQLAGYVVGENPVFHLEEALVRFEQRDMRGARKELERVLALPKTPHPYGENTYAIGQAYWEATRLWTGEAEEGLLGLTEAIENLRIAAEYIDSLRPVVASLLCERAYYFVTHKEPKAAEFDSMVALRMCRFPYIRSRTTAVQDEQNWRYPAPK